MTQWLWCKKAQFCVSLGNSFARQRSKRVYTIHPLGVDMKPDDTGCVAWLAKWSTGGRKLWEHPSKSKCPENSKVAASGVEIASRPGCFSIADQNWGHLSVLSWKNVDTQKWKIRPMKHPVIHIFSVLFLCSLWLALVCFHGETTSQTLAGDRTHATLDHTSVKPFQHLMMILHTWDCKVNWQRPKDWPSKYHESCSYFPMPKILFTVWRSIAVWSGDSTPATSMRPEESFDANLFLLWRQIVLTCLKR